MTTTTEPEPSPALSVVIVTDALETIARTLGKLRAQTVADRIELVLVTDDPDRLDAGRAELEAFWGTQVIGVGDIMPLAWSREPGIRAASAPVVALAESHSFHEPRWAEALLEAHRGPWTAVGPAVTNANPAHAVSWANLFLDYGPWLEPEVSREMTDLPGHNSSYKRSSLIGYGPELRGLLEAETLLHADLRARGKRLWMESGARMSHLNVTRPSSWLRERIDAGRYFASLRAAGWSRPRRLAYAAGSPLIPVLRAIRTVPVWRRCRKHHRLPRGLGPALLVSLSASAFGEFLGYALGGGQTMMRLAGMELKREEHLRPRSRPIGAD